MILAQKTDRTRSSYWLVRPGSIHESLVQLSLGDTVEKCHAWSPPVLSFSRSHPNPQEMDKKRGGGLLQRAMPPMTDEGSRIRPIASTYNVVITLVYSFFFGSSTDGRPSNNQRYKYWNFSAVWVGEFMEEIGFEISRNRTII